MGFIGFRGVGPRGLGFLGLGASVLCRVWGWGVRLRLHQSPPSYGHHKGLL